MMKAIKKGAHIYIVCFALLLCIIPAFPVFADAGEPYDAGNLPGSELSVFGALLIAAAIGFVTALIVTGIMRMQLHSVRGQAAADSYIISGSMQVTKRSDLFLYRIVDRREKPKENTPSRSGGSRTHTSSSGRRHGGGGKF